MSQRRRQNRRIRNKVRKHEEGRQLKKSFKRQRRTGTEDRDGLYTRERRRYNGTQVKLVRERQTITTHSDRKVSEKTEQETTKKTNEQQKDKQKHKLKEDETRHPLVA